MKRLLLLVLLIPVCLVATAQTPVQQIPLKKYLEYARASADYVYSQKDSIVIKWRKAMDPEDIFGYRAPGNLLEMAAIYATLYEMEGNKKYAERAKEVLLTYGDYAKEFPVAIARRKADYVDGVPALPDFFTTMRYLQAYDKLKDKGILSVSEKAKVEDLIAKCLVFLLRTQEWGAMNRSALRAETLCWAVRVLPNHPVTPMLKTYEQALLSDNWGKWEIEDASLYHGVWLYSLIGCADAKNQMKELFEAPTIYFYSRYFTQLMSPQSMIPDYGDAANYTNWNRWIVFFETAAKQYNNPNMKWAATMISQKFMDLSKPTSVGLGYMLLDAYRFGSDKIIPKAPSEMSEEVLEDMVGKKMVYRNGWDAKSTYMLLNYRDEGDGGLLYRDYLRNAIPIEEEKVTHGHADENSIALLTYKGSTLLTDGGYRDFLPSGYYGSFRQDYFHNRLCVRNEKVWFGQNKGEYRYGQPDHPAIDRQNIMDFMHNAGSYRKTRTQKVDFLTYPDHDYTRTRVIDDEMGYESDRVIVYVKDPEMFVVFDVLKSRSEQFFTGVNLWHAQKIVSQGNHWYDTKYETVATLKVPGDQNLLIYFPKNHYRFEQTNKENRNYQQEMAIAEYSGQFFELGQQTGFVTVLIPHSEKVNPETLIKGIEYVPASTEEAGMAVRIKLADKTIFVGMKSDLKEDLVKDYQRPKYDFATGKLAYGDIETNADFFYTEQKGDKLSFTVVNLTKATYKGKTLYEQPSSYFGLNFDGRQDAPDIGKARLWRDTIVVK
ncbi:MAG: hypothetical protein PHY99_01125 [Bacteroidales bacterium]|nr:hypothetical protein [Bacteroidales bacterium]